jgi:hypothetical protein
MSRPFDYDVSLRIRHPSAPAAWLVKGLPWPTKFGWTAGDARMTPKGTLLPGVRRESYSTLDVGAGEDGELVGCLRAVLAQLERHRDHLGAVRESGGSVSLYVFWYPNGDTGAKFDLDLLRQLSDLGIALDINVYEDLSGEVAEQT